MAFQHSFKREKDFFIGKEYEMEKEQKSENEGGRQRTDIYGRWRGEEDLALLNHSSDNQQT